MAPLISERSIPIGAQTEALPSQRAVLSLVLERRLIEGDGTDLIGDLVAAGVDWVQVRDRELSDSMLLDWAMTVANAARRGAARAGHPVCVLINRRCDIALAVGADGVHLGFDAVTPEIARVQLGAAALIGVSAHRGSEAVDGRRRGADYAHLAPIYSPLSKSATRSELGTHALRVACEGGFPILAQGGLTAETCMAAIDAGATGVAVTGTILQAGDPVAATRTLRRALDRGRN